RASHEIGLAVDLDEDADAAARVDVAADQALARLSAGLPARGGHAPLAQDLGRLLDIAVGLGQGALAVHHPRARALAEIADHLGGDLGHADQRLDSGPDAAAAAVAAAGVAGASAAG